MTEKKIVKTLRMSSEDSVLIQEFLKSNPGIDFSTLMRLALYKFLKDPSFEKPVKKMKQINEPFKELH